MKINKINIQKPKIRIIKKEKLPKFLVKPIESKRREFFSAYNTYDVKGQRNNVNSCGPYSIRNSFYNTQWIKDNPEFKNIFDEKNIINEVGNGKTTAVEFYQFIKKYTNLDPKLCTRSNFQNDFPISMENQNLRNFKTDVDIEKFLKDIVIKNKETIIQLLFGEHLTSVLYDVNRKRFVRFDSLKHNQYEVLEVEEIVEEMSTILNSAKPIDKLMYVHLMKKIKIKRI